MIKHVYKPSKREGGKRIFDRLYRGRFRLDGDKKITEIPLRTDDKQIAEQRLNKVVLELQREHDGLIAPKQEREAAQKMLAEHVEDFILTRQSVGCDGKYVKELRQKLLKLIDECAWRRPKDATAQSFEVWRARQSKSSETLNEYQIAICGLFKWLEPRLGANPLRFVQRAQTNGQKHRERCALTVDELRCLVAAAGPRGIVYHTAAFTGIRRGELAKLEWRDVNADGENPFIEVRASISKNHKQARQPLPHDLAKALTQYRPVGALPADLVFPRLIPRMIRFRDDLKAAGIDYVNGKGEFADFHAMRKTYGTMLTLLGIPERVIMELMRHSDMKLTAKTYTDAGHLPVAHAVFKLPSLTETEKTAPQIAHKV